MHCDKESEWSLMQKNNMEKLEFIKKEKKFVEYLGVRLEKGKGGPFVPEADFENDVITNFDLKLMRDIATALKLGQPMLLEGGSGLGKTRTIARMCAELNRELYYANGHDMEITDLIGKLTVKEGTKSGFGWQDGVVLQAVRNGGILFFDEYNFMKGETRGGLHQIFDALLQGKKYITIPENNNEQVKVHPDFRLIAAQNPPGNNYGDREVLDTAQIDRFLIKKLPERLPDEIRQSRLFGALGIDNEITLSKKDFLPSREEALSRIALQDIPGIEEILQKYLEATKHLRIAQEQGEIASREAQPVAFGTSRDDRRVLEFIQYFYNGDINDTIQKALELYYVNKISDGEEREKMRSILERVKVDLKDSLERIDLDELQEETERDGIPIVGSFEILESSGKERRLFEELKKVYEKEGVSNKLAWSLTGISLPEAMAFRRELLEAGASKDSIALSLAGVGTPEAMAFRRELFEAGADKDYIAEGLAGVGTPEAMAFRRELLEAGADKYSIARGLAGVGTPEAMAFRRELLEAGANKDSIAEGLAGVGTPEAMAFRRELLEAGASKRSIALSLAGVGTPEAMAFRRELLEAGADKDYIALSLAGVGTPEAMAFRRELLEAGADKYSIASSYFCDSISVIYMTKIFEK